MIKVIKGKNNNKMFKHIEQADARAHRYLGVALFDIGGRHVTHSKRLMDRQKSGKQYKINGKGHTASAPGQAPANISDKLKNSIDYTVHANNELIFGYRSTVGTPYGKYLEFGTKTIKKRPNIFATATHKQKQTHRLLIAAASKAFL